MAKVTVRMFATVREVARTDRIELEAGDVLDVLDQLGKKLGPSFKRLLQSLASDPERIVVLVNGKNPGHPRVLSQKLHDGDEIALFPPVSGG